MPLDPRLYQPAAVAVAEAAEGRARQKGTTEAYATGLLSMLLIYATHGDEGERAYARAFVDDALAKKGATPC